ncbi:hypothetical protein [Bradyrhizobium sp. USDA 4353]
MTPIAQLSESVARTGLPQEASLYLLSIFCGLLFGLFTSIEIRRRIVLLEGYGGRLGVLAAFGSLLFVTLGPSLAGQGDTLHLGHLTQFDQELDGSLAILAACLAGTFLTLFIQRLPHVADAGRAARTFVSATLAFAGMAIIQALWPDQRCLVDAYYAGCFLGMSSPQRLSGALQPIVAALTLAVVLVQASTVLPMVGGSLGLAAFIAVAAVDLARRAGNALPAPALSMKVGLGPSLAVALAVAGCLLPSHLFFGLADDATDASREAAAVLAPALVTLPDEPIVNAAAPEAASPAVAPAAEPGPVLLVGAQAEPVVPEIAPRVETPAEVTPAPAPRAEPLRIQRAKRAGAGSPSSPANAGPWGIIRAGELGRTGAVGARPRAKPAPVRSVDAASAAPQPAARAQPQSAPKRTARAVATAAPE